eukprot:Hpha_TRINITY_DN15479_c5_g6::TRINITY_DN15479_c5_g6_i1::g.173278::m.173278
MAYWPAQAQGGGWPWVSIPVSVSPVQQQTMQPQTVIQQSVQQQTLQQQTLQQQTVRVVAVPVVSRADPIVVCQADPIPCQVAVVPQSRSQQSSGVVVARLADPSSPSDSRSDTSSGTNDGPTYLTLVELRHGRKRVATGKQQLASGAHVLIHTIRGDEIGTVCSQRPIPSSDGTPRYTITAEVGEKFFDSFEKEASQAEADALFHARNVVAELDLSITFHCATMQYKRHWIVLHFTTKKQERLDLKRLLKELRSRLNTNIWFNNCTPSPGCPGETIDPIFFTI